MTIWHVITRKRVLKHKTHDGYRTLWRVQYTTIFLECSSQDTNGSRRSSQKIKIRAHNFN